jgi:hypothetical protein
VRAADAAVVRAAVVAVATAFAIRAAVKAKSAAPGNRNCQAGLCLFKQCERHRRRGSNAEEVDADGRCEGKKLGHSFLLSPRVFRCTFEHYSLIKGSMAHEYPRLGFHKLFGRSKESFTYSACRCRRFRIFDFQPPFDGPDLYGESNAGRTPI